MPWDDILATVALDQKRAYVSKGGDLYLEWRQVHDMLELFGPPGKYVRRSIAPMLAKHNLGEGLIVYPPLDADQFRVYVNHHCLKAEAYLVTLATMLRNNQTQKEVRSLPVHDTCFIILTWFVWP